MPHQCWVSGLFCNVSLNALYDDLRHRNIPVCTDILEELFCPRRDPELRGRGHIDIPMVGSGISICKSFGVQIWIQVYHQKIDYVSSQPEQKNRILGYYLKLY